MFRSFLFIALVLIGMPRVNAIKAAPSNGSSERKEYSADNKPQPGPSETNHTGVEKIEGGIEPDASKDNKQQRITSKENFALIMGMCTLLMLVGQTLISWRMGRIMREQHQLAVITERAYLGLDDFHVSMVDGVLIVNAIVVNGGRTPAWRFHIKKRIYLGTQGTNFNYGRIRVSDESVLLISGAKKNVDFMPFSLSKEERASFESRRHSVFVDGVCHYCDFRGRWKTFGFGHRIYQGSEGVGVEELYQYDYSHGKWWY